MPWPSPAPAWSHRRSLGFRARVTVGAAEPPGSIVTVWPSAGVVVTWYSVPEPAISSVLSSVSSTQSPDLRPRLRSLLRLVAQKLGPVTVAGGEPPGVGCAEIRLTTLPFSLDHLNVAVP